MPIYEFYCADCHRVFHFLSRTVETRKRPDCPRCGRRGIERRPSSFAISKGRKEAEGERGLPEVDDARLERAMEAMASEFEGIDENDPRQAARAMRRLYEAAGVPVTGGIEEAMRRMEAGEDPDSVEEEMGDALEGDPFAPPAGGKLGRVRRKYLPPSVDATLHEL